MATEAMIGRIRRCASPLIRRQLAAAGIDVEAFRLEDLPRLEALTPESLDLERLADPIGELRLTDAPGPVRLGTSDRGETTIVLTWTARDLERAAAAGARALACAGIRKGMKLANTLEGGFTTPGSLILGDAAEALGALDIPLGPAKDGKAAKSTVDLLDRVGVDVLVLDAPSAPAMQTALATKPPGFLRGILWLGQDRPPEGLPGWLRRWISVPEVSVFAAVECRAGRLHLDDDLIPEAFEGRLLLSCAAGDMPILRFDAGIAGALGEGVCGCGTRGRWMSR